jgi:glycerophosphoryl diester phosphodiesterase
MELTRRAALALGGLVLLTGCAPSPRLKPSPSAKPAKARSVSDLLSSESFYIAHRGSGDNWPEHTLTAYRSALAAGADAVEVSVCATADGVLVCHHDTSAARTLGVDRDIADMTWAELREMRVDARSWLGADTPLEPVSRVDEVLETLGDDVLVFIEDKQGTNTRALLDLMDAQPRSKSRFVWKQWAPAKQVALVKEHGYHTWGYFFAEQMERLDEFAGTFDALGVPTQLGDDDLSRVVATGKPVICWEVHFHSEVVRLERSGVAGKMCSNIPYLRDARTSGADDFASGRRAAGDLPSGFDRLGWAAQPALIPGRDALRMQSGGPHSYLMGSLAKPGRSLVDAGVSISWPDTVPPAGTVGVVLALTSDEPGGQGERGQASGYELHIASDGRLQLRERIEGRGGRVLAEAPSNAPRAGEVIEVAVAMDPQRIQVQCGRANLEVIDERWRGPWIRLFKDYDSSLPVDFSGVSATLA